MADKAWGGGELKHGLLDERGTERIGPLTKNRRHGSTPSSSSDLVAARRTPLVRASGGASPSAVRTPTLGSARNRVLEKGMSRVCLCALFFVLACKSEPSVEPAASEDGLPSGDQGPSAELSAADCEADGGVVVGDIGDGAIFKADYTCENGEPPRARISADPAGPMGVEGSVCC